VFVCGFEHACLRVHVFVLIFILLTEFVDIPLENDVLYTCIVAKHVI